MKIQITCTSPALIPNYQTPGSAAVDLHADIPADVVLHPGQSRVLGTGISVAIPTGYVGLVVVRSGLGIKRRTSLSNAVGVIDSDYRGEILVGLENHGTISQTIQPGNRIAQLMFIAAPQVDFETVRTLETTGRGTGGLGSTGA